MRTRIGWSSHFVVLHRIMPRVTGPVLELGIGFYSTPFLHWVCHDMNVKLVSYEKVSKYYKFFKRFANKNHTISLIDDWDNLVADKHWGLVFIDHDRGRRQIEALKFANHADYVVIHDTQDCGDGDLREITKHFKYRKDFDNISPRTSVLSNFKEVSDI